jgi:hypothetical protein
MWKLLTLVSKQTQFLGLPADTPVTMLTEISRLIGSYMSVSHSAIRSLRSGNVGHMCLTSRPNNTNLLCKIVLPVLEIPKRLNLVRV